ncbi:hypothetical protein ACJX0J_019835, partial [Zea mays]
NRGNTTKVILFMPPKTCPVWYFLLFSKHLKGLEQSLPLALSQSANPVILHLSKSISLYSNVAVEQAYSEKLNISDALDLDLGEKFLSGYFHHLSMYREHVLPRIYET